MIAIQPSSRQTSEKKADKRSKAEVWALPKGIVDAGETPEITAVREVREETGVEAELVQKLGDVKYVYVRSWGDGARVFKVVSFFLLRYRRGRIGDLPPETRFEIARVKWVPLEQAERLLTYKGDREMARSALRLLRASVRTTEK